MSKPTMGLRRAGIASVATGALALSGVALGAGAANAVPGFAFDRINGDDRYATAALVADEYGDSTNVILANGEQGSYADALSANLLAGEIDAPILLTRDDVTPDDTMQQLEDMGAENITVVGGPGVVSDAQIAALEDAGYTVTRIAGTDRFETNADVIMEGPAAAGNTGLIATGFNFADALAAGPFAYKGHPLGLSTNDDIDDEVVDALEAKGVEQVLIFGGPNAVGAEVEAELATAGITVAERFAGSDRSETSELAAEWALDNLEFSNTGVNVASGYVQGSGADALAGGPLTGQQNRPLLITRNVDSPDDVLDYLEAHNDTLTEGIIFGGPGAISADAEAAMNAAAQGEGNQDFTIDQTAATNTIASEPSTDDDRQYSVTGLDNTKTYNIELIPAENVSGTDTGVVTFADEPDNDEADGLGDTGAIITVVNGAPFAGGDSATAGPVNGTVNFTVDYDGTDPEEIRPVIYVDDTETAGNTTGQLDLNDANEPVEQFAVGGEKAWVPTEADGGAFDVDVTRVNKDADSFIGDDDSATPGLQPGGTFFYDSNDTFSVDGVPSTMAGFEAELSRGDAVDGTYAPDPAASSTFNLADNAPAAPTGVATAESDGTVTISWAAPGTNPDSYNLYRSVDTNDTDEADDPLTGAVNEDGSSCQAAGNAAYTLVKSVAGSATSTTDAPAAADTYCYRVTAVVDGEESDMSNASDITVPEPAETTRPTITDAVLDTDAGFQGQVDTGDIWSITFSENMDETTTDGSGAFVLIDADGDRFTVACGAASATSCVLGPDADSNADRVLDITVGAVSDENTGAGDGVLEYPVSITTTNAAVQDDAGNVVDLGSSADVVVDSE